MSITTHDIQSIGNKHFMVIGLTDQSQIRRYIKFLDYLRSLPPKEIMFKVSKEYVNILKEGMELEITLANFLPSIYTVKQMLTNGELTLKFKSMKEKK